LLNGIFNLILNSIFRFSPLRFNDRFHDFWYAIAQSFEEAKQDLERREKKAKHKRTMYMRKNALEHARNTRPIERTQNLIDRMPKVMEAIIEAEGGKSKY